MARSSSRSLALAAVLVLAVGVGACGSDDGDAADGTTTSATEASATTGGAASSTTVGGGPSTTPATATTGGASTTVAEGDLPGERIDLYPYEGAELGVVGVAADDVLNVRTGPGASFDLILTLAPSATGIEATGHNRQVDDGLWVEVVVDGKAGWANGAFLSQPGATTDITAQLADVPAGTLAELGRAVAAQRASTEPPSKVTVVAGPTEGDPGEVTVDVLGLGDDSQRGERLRIVATPSGGSYAVTTVEATALCARGVTAEGLCT